MLDAARQPAVTLLPNEVRVRDVHFDDGTGQIVEAVGTLALRAPAESSLHVSVRGLDLLPIEELAGQENPEFAGLLNGGRAHHRHRGEAGRAGLVRHHARPLSRAAVRARRRRGPLRRPAPRRRRRRRAGARASRWRSTAASRWGCSRAARRAHADAGPAGGGAAPIDLNIESSAIGLQVVTGLTTAIEQVTGTATVKLRVTGTADNPLFDGGVTLDGGAFTVPATGRRYSDLATRITFEPGRMKVDDLKVLDEEGDALQVSGVLGLRRLAFGDVQMHAQAQALRVRPQRPGAPRGRSRARRDRAGDAPDDCGHGRD